MKPLQGKIALVTGARAGLGAATVLALARAGANVIATGRREGDCAATVAAAGAEALELALDVADLAAIPARIQAALRLFGRVDVLVNNAATIEPMGALGTLDALAFDHAMRLNVSGPAALTSALWPHMANGRIINIVSGAARSALPGWAAYCASKAGLLMLTESIALEGAGQNLLAFAFAPGLVDTQMQASIRAAKINRVSDVPRENLLPASTPARAIAWLAAGYGDDLAGQFIDIRDAGLQDRIGADMGEQV